MINHPWTMSDMVKYRAAIWSFLKLTALYLTISDIVYIPFCASKLCLISHTSRVKNSHSRAKYRLMTIYLAHISQKRCQITILSTKAKLL